MNDALRELESVNRGFRSGYLRYQQLTAQLEDWAARFPTLAHLESLGRTPQGRELWLLTVGPDPQRRRPGVWVDGNMHAIEFAGSSVALAIAEDALKLHLAPEARLHTLARPVREAARRVLFYVMPRISPDGAEELLTSGRHVRSVPRDARPAANFAYWRGADLDGDGLALLMRKRDASGEYVASSEYEGLMLHRRIEHEGPFYKLYPEGVIEHFDGHDIPTPHLLADNAPDLNRNFPYGWGPEHQQAGAGPYPASEPETRALVEFAGAHPNLFAWLNLHTVGGFYVRPPSRHANAPLLAFDRALYRQLEAWAEPLTGYPTVSGYEEYAGEGGAPLRGSLTDYAHYQRGCLALTCELWDVFAQLGIERKHPFVDHYTHISEDDARRLAAWDRTHNKGRIFRAWRRFEHPQLGEVELGGFDQRFGLTNPPMEILHELCTAQAGLWLRVAALAPQLEVSALRCHPMSEDVSRVEATVSNAGYLPTHVLESARGLEWNLPVRASLRTEGCRLAQGEAARRDLGHLDGWGRGLYGEDGGLFDPRSRGSTSRRTVAWIVRGHGAIAVEAGSPRAGFVQRRLEV